MKRRVTLDDIFHIINMFHQQSFPVKIYFHVTNSITTSGYVDVYEAIKVYLDDVCSVNILLGHDVY